MAKTETLKFQGAPYTPQARNSSDFAQYRVYSQISIARNKHNGAAFSNLEHVHSDLVFLLKKITKKLNSQFPQTLLAEICSKPVSTCP